MTRQQYMDVLRARKGVRTAPPFAVGTFKRCTKCGENKEVILENFSARVGIPEIAMACCKQCVAERSKIIRKNLNPEQRKRALQKSREWMKKNPQSGREKQKLRMASGRYKDRINERRRERRRTEPAFNIRNRIGGQLRGALKNIKKCQPTFDLVGYSPEELKKCIERQFTTGMNWQEFGLGRIHLDHIVPLADFRIDLDPSPANIRRAWALTNLRPLWASENIKKGKKRTFLL